ncbi:uncharacterized protein Z518_01475 [Rhinocladiella mackenziei CBS 650.93]|uniref:Uncharacterized protein n=1 Tax=Rhinocladiella mackenziei CBS 650.93 TaxID=1442369 RepID=A0A0D2HI85_9EURO|nr:uncharacterized protein Z518_01475 [Rhinocladiella mackenziei CBS 650.93]KIX10393.1 hypothetical protein Z518_01475 [Rhinocladiella mackenziei CBS 650.93]
MDVHNAWPSAVRNIKWPTEGVMYTYEHRGYIRPEKLEYWLTQLFGPGKAKYVLFNQRLYIKSPRKPNAEEKEWMEDPDPESVVDIEGYGRMTLNSKKTDEKGWRSDVWSARR